MGFFSSICKSLARKGLVSHFPSKSGMIKYTGNAHMFIDDMGKSILPLRGKSGRNPDFEIKIVGNDSEKARSILKSITQVRKYYSDSELVCDTINDLAKNIYYFSGLVFEVSSEEKLPILKFVIPYNLISLPFVSIQFIPSSDRQLFGTVFRYEFNKNIIKMSLFHNVYSRLKFRLTLWLLKLSDGVSPEFFRRNMFRNDVGLSIEEFSRMRAKFISVITRPYCWKQRSLSNKYTNEYFLVYSGLKSAAKKASDRNGLKSQLNKLFSDMKIDARIEISGIPSHEFLLNSVEELKNGELSFKKSIDLVFF